MMVHCHLCWPGTILQSKSNHCGMAGASYVLGRGNALAQGNRGLVERLGGERRPARALCARLAAAFVVSREVKDGLPDGVRDSQ